VTQALLIKETPTKGDTKMCRGLIVLLEGKKSLRHLTKGSTTGILKVSRLMKESGKSGGGKVLQELGIRGFSPGKGQTVITYQLSVENHVHYVEGTGTKRTTSSSNPDEE